MRNAFLTDTLRSVTHSWGRFFAIAAIVALGCGFYAGLRMTAPDMKVAADEYFDGAALMDIRVVSTLGLTDGDMEALRKVEGVEAVMPAYETDVLVDMGGEQYATRVHSLPAAASKATCDDGVNVLSDDADYLNRLVLMEGRWPEKAGECVLPSGLAVCDGVQLGEVLEVQQEKSSNGEDGGSENEKGASDPSDDSDSDSSGDSDSDSSGDSGSDDDASDSSLSVDDVLKPDRYTVVGFAYAPYYATASPLGNTDLGSGTIQLFMYVPETDFSDDLPYTEAFVTVTGAAGEFGSSDAYDDRVAEVKARIEAIAPERERLRVEELRETAQATLDEKREEYEAQKADAEEQLAEAEQKLEDAKKTLTDSEKAIDDGLRDTNKGYEELDKSKEEAKEKFEQAEKDVEEGKKAMEAAKPQLDDGRKKLEAAWKQYSDGEAAYRDGLAQWQSQSDALEDGMAQLRDGIAQAQAGIAQADEAIAKLDAGIAQAQTGRDQAQASLDALLSDPNADAAQVEALRKQVAELDGTIAALTKQREEAAASKAQAEAALPGLQSQLSDLEGQRPTLDAAKQELDKTAKTLSDSRAQLMEQQQAFDKQQRAYDDAKEKVEAGEKELTEGKKEAEKQFEEAQKKLDDASKKLEEAEKKLADGQKEYDKGLKEYEDSKAEVDEKLNDAERQLADAQRAIDELETPEWLVMDRAANYGVVSFESDADRVDHIAAVFPFLFFLVAALVALTTMTRMVDEERVLIGTFKALGYGRIRIASKYLAYAAVASGIGSIVGILVLTQVLPVIIMHAYAIIYFVPIPPLPMPIDLSIAGLAAGLGVGITLFATAAAAWSTLRERPALLMLPRAPKAGKRILLERFTPLWSKLTFSWKVTLRNIFRYKKRLFMTVVGIAGCTALLLTGLGLSNAINDIIDKQYGELTRYDTMVRLDDHIIQADRNAVDEVMDDRALVERSMPVVRESLLASGPDATDKSLDLFVPSDPGRFPDFFIMREREGHAPIELAPDGLVLTEKVAAELGVAVGDPVTLTEQDSLGNPTGNSVQAQITGICENYVFHYAFMGPSLYKALYGQEPAYDYEIAISASDQTRELLLERLDAIPGVKTVAFNDETIDTYRRMLKSVDMIVVVLVVAAAALAFIVLYNLTNINITERIREIATLKVLGFTPKETTAYIFREILLLAALGAFVGLFLGVGMESFVVTTAEVDQVMFGREIHPLSFVLAFALTLLFTLIVRAAMKPKLHKVNMVESLKSNE